VRDFDAIVSNPPYIPLSDAASLAPEVRDHEPHMALFAGSTGLDIYQRLIPQAHAYLRPGGLLAMEFGFGQRESLRTLLTTTPRAFADIRFIDDYAGIPRIALATRL
jgi:release factor glutamine methyltransferase